MPLGQEGGAPLSGLAIAKVVAMSAKSKHPPSHTQGLPPCMTTVVSYTERPPAYLKKARRSYLPVLSCTYRARADDWLVWVRPPRLTVGVPAASTWPVMSCRGFDGEM